MRRDPLLPGTHRVLGHRGFTVLVDGQGPVSVRVVSSPAERWSAAQLRAAADLLNRAAAALDEPPAAPPKPEPLRLFQSA